jgi:hypothetical protein
MVYKALMDLQDLQDLMEYKDLPVHKAQLDHKAFRAMME